MATMMTVGGFLGLVALYLVAGPLLVWAAMRVAGRLGAARSQERTAQA